MILINRTRLTEWMNSLVLNPNLSGEVMGVTWELLEKNYAGNVQGKIYRYDFLLSRYDKNGKLLRRIKDYKFSYSQDINEVAESLIHRLRSIETIRHHGRE